MAGLYVPPNTLDWERFEQWLTDELQSTYQRMSSLDLSQPATDQARGKAAFIKTLLNLRNTPRDILPPGQN